MRTRAVPLSTCGLMNLSRARMGVFKSAGLGNSQIRILLSLLPRKRYCWPLASCGEKTAQVAFTASGKVNCAPMAPSRAQRSEVGKAAGGAVLTAVAMDVTGAGAAALVGGLTP